MKKNNQKIVGGIIATIGYLLSPLSWWNDLIINIPLAYLFASFCNLFVKGLFSMFMILGYWISCVLGIILMQKGITTMSSKKSSKYSVDMLRRDLLWSLVYSIAIALLFVTKIIKLPTELFRF